MKTISKNMVPIMVALIAVSAGAAFAVSHNIALQSLGYTSPSPESGTYMTGHVEAIVRDNDGVIKAYRQADNAIVTVGLESLADQLFFEYTEFGGASIDGQNNHTNSTGGRFGYMNIGNASTVPDALNVGLACPLLSAGDRACAPGGASESQNRPSCGAITSKVWNTKAIKRTDGLFPAQLNVTAIATFDGANCNSGTIQEAGMWNNNTTPAVAPKGQMFARNTFGAVTLTTTDSLELTWRFTFTDN